MDDDTVLLERDAPMAVLTINRPDKLNALTEGVLLRLRQRLEEIGRDAALRVVIVTGAGRAFVAGADLKAMADMTSVQAVAFSRDGSAVFRMIERMDAIFIAAVNGFALGGGCELMCACDLRIASDAAVIGQPEVGVGIHPGFGGTQRLARLVGPGKAKELILLGDPVKADEALRIGLVERVVPADALMDEARSLAGAIAARGPTAVAAAKRAVNDGLSLPIDDGLELESTLFGESFGAGDAKEGMEAFLEKRQPQWD